MFHNLVSSSGLSRCKTKISGGVFPLPETFEVLSSVFPQLPETHVQVLRMACCALNSYFGVKAAKEQAVTRVARQALEAISAYVTTCEFAEEKFDWLSWDLFMATKGIDYEGEEVKLVKP